MNPDYSMVGFLGILAFWFLFIGLRGVITQKPFLISFWWFFVLLGLALVAGVLTEGIGVLLLFSVMLIVVAVICWFWPQGYDAYGVTDGSLRKGLLASLTRLNLTYEETPDGLRLPTIGADLLVKGPLWGRRVRMKQRQFGRVLRDIVKEINEYYGSVAVVEVNMKDFTWTLVTGGIFALLALLFAFHKVL